MKLKELGTILTGNTPKKSDKLNYNSNDICFVKPSDISEKEITHINHTEYYIANHAYNSARLAPKNSILITCIGIIGKIAILEKECAFNQQINAIIPNEKKIIPHYLAYALKYKKKSMQDKANAPVVPIINKTEFSEINIKVPSLEKQKNIVDILIKVDKIINWRFQQLNKLNQFISSLFIEMFGDPIKNPMNWNKEKLENKCQIITGNTPSRKIDNYYGNYIEWIKSDNIDINQSIITKAVEYLSEKGLKVGRCVDNNSILMTCIAGSIKCIGNVAITNRKVAFNQQINAIVPNNQNVWFMYIQFKICQQYIQGSINMSLKGILSKSRLSELLFIFPPMKLQNQFAERVQQIDKSKLAIQQSLEKLEILKKSLMQEYFG